MRKGKKPARAHKGAREKKKLERVSEVRIIGGYIRRSMKPNVTGNKIKSQMIRVDANFANLLRNFAVRYGGITEVTRKLHAKGPLLMAMLEEMQDKP